MPSTAALVRLALPALAALLATPLAVAEVSLDADRAGNDIARFADPDLSNDQCAARCEGDARCQAWVLVKDGSQGGVNVCYLKSVAARATPNRCCDTGTKADRPLHPGKAPGLQRPTADRQRPEAPAPTPGLRVQADVLRARGDPTAGIRPAEPLFIRSAPLLARGDPRGTGSAAFTPVRITTPRLRATGARP